jgi:hypothetical protein
MSDSDSVDSEEDKTVSWDDVRKYWDGYLSDFTKELYYPVFAKHQISKAQAMIIYELRIIRGILGEENNDDGNEDEEWKKPT